MPQDDDHGAKRRKRGARFIEVAIAAGVSVATVDRVLNERDSVSEKTRRKVLAVAADLNLPRLLPEPDHALVHVDILLPRNETPFFQRLVGAFQDGVAMLDRRVIVHRRSLAEGDSPALAAAIRTPPPYRRAGFIFAAPDLPAIREAVAVAQGRGEKAVTVVTDLPDLPGLVYCGMDNRRAGRVAGQLMGQMARGPGRVVAVSNSMAYRAHRERIAGFAEVIAAFPALEFAVIEPESHDDPERCFHAVRHALSSRAAVVTGLYNTGAGSEGICRALLAMPGEPPVWIGHEISDDHVSYLRQDLMQVAIDQDPRGQAIAALQSLLSGVGVLGNPASASGAELRIHTKFSLA